MRAVCTNSRHTFIFANSQYFAGDVAVARRVQGAAIDQASMERLGDLLLDGFAVVAAAHRKSVSASTLQPSCRKPDFSGMTF
jgi:hypothetical protein